ncbi:MAG TPA: dUTPase [Nitrososphaeraceae archaeon]|nr:dUTPase [Nitrososphaeraceae archaeon]
MNKDKFTADRITSKVEPRMMSDDSNSKNNDNRQDILEYLFRKQNELHQTLTNYAQSNGSQYSKKFLSLSKEERLSALCTAIIHEAVELQRLTNWKWWKKTVEFDKNHAKEELIDIWHFVVDASIELEMTPHDILTAYIAKNQINRDRQKNGY